MIKIQPHIIQEGSVQFQLGEQKGNQIIYDFQKMLIYLEAKGKLLFGKNFKIYPEDEAILYKLCVYFIRDFETCRKLKINPNKGILLSGPVGCGKTSLMKLLSFIVPHQNKHRVIAARNITFNFNKSGFKIIEDYGNNGFYCFDDLGVETTGRHFGKDCNVMGEILLSRYDLFINSVSLRAQSRSPSSNHSCHPALDAGSHNSKQLITKSQKPILTHATTNLNAQELENRYGNRVRSRMRELFNLIAFDKESLDKRK
jgi:energy-coupling factor transporter ATP-binding protein EcfA2